MRKNINIEISFNEDDIKKIAEKIIKRRTAKIINKIIKQGNYIESINQRLRDVLK